MGKQAALYSRVSTAAQEDNTSLDGQLERCRAFAMQQGYDIVAEEREAVSGEFVLSRPKFNRLLQLASEGKLGVIVVDIPDRLGRGDAIPKLELLAELNGAQIVYANRSYDTDTLEGLVRKSADTLVSGIERLNIARRNSQGRIARAKGGRVIASSHRLYGYRFKREFDERGRKIGCQLEIVESEAEVIRNIYRWYVVGDEQDGRLSIYGITKKLTEMEVPTLYDIEGKRAKNHQGGWPRSTVHSILSNETYAGLWHYSKKQKVRRDGVVVTTVTCLKPKSEWIPVKVPNIVSRELWEAARERLSKNRSMAAKPTRRKYLLRGRIKCVRCGCRLGGSFKTSKYGETGYYRCRRTSADYSDRCDLPVLRQDAAEQWVWGTVAEALLEPEMLFEGLRAKRERAAEEYKLLLDAITVTEAQITKLEQKLERLLELYLDGEIAKPTYLQRRAQVGRKIEEKQQEKTDRESQFANQDVISEEAETEALQFCQEVSIGLEHVTFEDKVKILDLLDIALVTDGETVTLTGVIPTATAMLSSKSQ